MMDGDLSQLTARAGDKILQEDLSCRINQTINCGMIFYMTLSSSKIVMPKVGDVEEDDSVLFKSDLLGVEDVEEDVEDEVSLRSKRMVDGVAYSNFLGNFVGLWLESKDSIGDDQWAREGLKKELEEYFSNASEGVHEYSALYGLFEDYLSSLNECGILDFTRGGVQK